MPLYPMQCVQPTFEEAREAKHPTWCGHSWDWHTRQGVYMYSQAADFRNVTCPRCGRLGARRIYPADSAPSVPKVQGTWGESAPPELRGKTFLNKEERDDQLKHLGDSGQVVVPTEGRGEHKKSSKVQLVPKQEPRKWETTVAEVPEVPRAHASAEDTIIEYLTENGPSRRGVLIEALNMNPNTLNAALRASKTIRRVKRGVYGL